MRRYDRGDISIQSTPAEISIICNDNRGRYATVKKKAHISPTETLCQAITLYMKLDVGLNLSVVDASEINQSERVL